MPRLVSPLPEISTVYYYQVQEEIAKMYATVCERNHQTPSRIMTLDHIRSTANNETKRNQAQSSTEMVR